MKNQIGDSGTVNTSSMALNGQKGDGAQKPKCTGGDHNPGDTKPPKAPMAPVPMPK